MGWKAKCRVMGLTTVLLFLVWDKLNFEFKIYSIKFRSWCPTDHMKINITVPLLMQCSADTFILY